MSFVLALVGSIAPLLPVAAKFTGIYKYLYISGIEVVVRADAVVRVPATSSKGAGPSMLEGQSGYGSTMQDSPKFTYGDYPAATQKILEGLLQQLLSLKWSEPELVEVIGHYSGKPSFSRTCVPTQGDFGPLISEISATPNFVPTVSNNPPFNNKKSNIGLIVWILVPVVVVLRRYIKIYTELRSPVEKDEIIFEDLDAFTTSIIA
ncbi:unnamed protein product [Lactuca saligna]|uniref:Uncharacterized protein n=1 Tax=Lactuca saligna TaxID=75948 RepID=A0AA36E9U8_LACSI|nr:unnamed protein product [Lactuca saligna]